MPKELCGEVRPPEGRVGVIVAEVNKMVTERLLAGALDELRNAGVADDQIDVIRVPGSFEIPAAARALKETGRYSALVLLGCVIRGETDHYVAVMSEAARGTAELARTGEVGIGFGVLTCHTVEQALDRCGDRTNAGRDAARTALYMADLLKKLHVS